MKPTSSTAAISPGPCINDVPRLMVYNSLSAAFTMLTSFDQKDEIPRRFSKTLILLPILPNSIELSRVKSDMCFIGPYSNFEFNESSSDVRTARLITGSGLPSIISGKYFTSVTLSPADTLCSN